MLKKIKPKQVEALILRRGSKTPSKILIDGSLSYSGNSQRSLQKRLNKRKNNVIVLKIFGVRNA